LQRTSSRSALGRRTDRLLANATLAQLFIDADSREIAEYFSVVPMLISFDAVYDRFSSGRLLKPTAR